MIAENKRYRQRPLSRGVLDCTYFPDAHAKQRPYNFAERMVDAWYENEGQAVRILLGCFVVTWTVYHSVANLSIGLHADNLEMFAWARHPQPGYQPHPPLGALVATVWFSIFPAADWAFNLLTMVNAAIALYAVDLIARRYLVGDKRLLVLLLLLMTPFYQLRAQRFSVNASLLSTWPIATYCFLRAFESRRPGWSAAAGAAAAAAMLAKYYTIYLIVGFIIAAMAHRDRWTYMKSPSPWISMVVGFLLLSPHIYWLATTGFQPFDYALRVHARAPIDLAFWKAAVYAMQGIVYVLVPTAVLWLASRPRFRTLAGALWPQQDDLRMLAILLWAPLVLPMVTAPLFGGLLTPLWTMQGWFLLPILLLVPKQIVLPRAAAVKVCYVLLVVTIAFLLAAPALALARHIPAGKRLLGVDDYRVTRQVVADRVTAIWRDATGRPLTIVAGGNFPPYAVTFYSPDHPDSVFAYDGTLVTFDPWITVERLRREGWLAVCPRTDDICISRSQHFVGDQEILTVEFDVVVTFWGWAREPKPYIVFLAPPKD